jgi:hypothetical protein
VANDEAQRAWREWLVQAHHGASQDFDKAVFTLSGGALAISLAFLRDIAPTPSHEWALATAWALLTSSLVLIFISLLTSQAAILRQIKQLDSAATERRSSFFGRATAALNGCAAAAGVIGVTFLVLFAFYNLD